MEGAKIYQDVSRIKQQEAASGLVGSIGALIEARKEIEVEVCVFDTWQEKMEYVPLEPGQHYVFNICDTHLPLNEVMHGENPAEAYGHHPQAQTIVHEFVIE